MNSIEVILPNTPENPSDLPVINIKLDKEIPNGFAGEFQLTGDNRLNIDPSLDLMAKMGKFVIFAGYSPSFAHSPEIETNIIKENLILGTTSSEKSVSHTENLSHDLSLGGSYSISKEDIIKLSFSSRKGATDNYTTSSSSTGRVNESRYHSESIPKLNAFLTYKHFFDRRSSLSFLYDLSNSESNDYQKINSLILNSGVSSLSHRIEGDILKWFGNKHLMNINAQFIDRNYSSFSENEGYEDALEYRQDLINIRGRYSFSLKKFNVHVNTIATWVSNKGLFTGRDGVSPLDYGEFKVFPALAFNYRPKRSFHFSIQYSTTAMRPDISYLNPHIDMSDPQNIRSGNPNLKSEYAHSLKLSFTWQIFEIINCRVESGWRYINNAIEKMSVLNDNNVSVTSYYNVGVRNENATRLDISYRPLKGLYISVDGTYKYLNYHNPLTGVGNEAMSFGCVGYVQYSIKKTFINAEIEYSPQMSSVQTKDINHFLSYSFALSQMLAKDKLFIYLYINNPFENHSFITNQIGDESFIMTTSREKLGRTVGIRLTWNFGNMKNSQSKDEGIKVEDLSRQEMLKD